MNPADLCQAFDLTGWWLIICVAVIGALAAVAGYRTGITAQRTLPDQPADPNAGGS